MAKRCVILGIQRSGTNFTETVFKQNFEHIQIVNNDRNYIWKHSYNIELDKFSRDVIHIYITKSPYCWIESIIRKKVDILKRNDWIRADENTANRFKHSDIDIIKLAKLWNDHCEWYSRTEVADKIQYQKIQYENLIQSRNNILTFLENIRDIYKLNGKFSDANSLNIPDKVSQSDAWNNQKKEMYLKN